MRHSCLVFSFIFFLFACSGPQNRYPETSMDAGREFIRACLDGDFDAAGKLVLEDEENRQLFDSYKRFYGRLPAEKKENYRKASYEINKYTEADDSTALINYSNSYMDSPMEIKLVRKEGKWKIDFKYAYAGKDLPE